METKDMESSQTPNIRELVKEKSVTMEYFLESSHLDAATADMLKKYDRDGNGSFSKEEVVAIILDLREAMQSNEMLGASNKFFRRMLIGVSIFALLLLTSMFGLSYAVAALTAKLDVSTDGTMTTTDGKTNVATEASSYKIVPELTEDTGAYCIPIEEADSILAQAMSGRTNVLVEFPVNSTSKEVHHLSGGQVTTDGAKTCFTNSMGIELCMEPSDDCEHPARRLEEYDCIEYVTGDIAFYDEINGDTCRTQCEGNGGRGGSYPDYYLTEAGATCWCNCKNLVKISRPRRS